jgi:SPP1 family predicted phage head-tail adaptor
MNLNGKVTNPGEMRTTVALQNPTLTPDAGGAQVPTWSTFATVKAKWTNVHGSEVWASQAVQAISPATVLIRYHSSVTTSSAVLKGSELYKVVSVDNIQDRNEYMELKVVLAKGSV